MNEIINNFKILQHLFILYQQPYDIVSTCPTEQSKCIQLNNTTQEWFLIIKKESKLQAGICFFIFIYSHIAMI